MHLSICRPILARARDTITTTPEALAAISSAIEDVVLHGIDEAQVVAGFGRLSRLVPHRVRYAALSSAARVSVCAVPDCALPLLGLTLLPLRPEWPASSEWFIAVSAPTFSVALLAADIGGVPDYGGGFQTLYSSDPLLVDSFWHNLSVDLGLPWSLPSWRDTAAQQRHVSLLGQRLLHHQHRRAVLSSHARVAGTPLPAPA